MQFELRSNGVNQIELVPETEIERAFVRAFAAGAAKGRSVKLAATSEEAGAPLGLIVSMEK
jgi:hypothetical protein